VADCLNPASWQSAAVGHPDLFTLPGWHPPQLALGPDGRTGVAFSDATRTVSYLE